jgi:hypothetical protein
MVRYSAEDHEVPNYGKAIAAATAKESSKLHHIAAPLPADR